MRPDTNLLTPNVPIGHIAVMGDLERFMRAKGLTDESVADAVGVSRPYVTRLRQGKRSPSLELALKIEAWSEGKVRVAGLSRTAAADGLAST